MAQHDAIICDLGDVFFTLPLQSSHTLSTKHLRLIFSSSTWFEYEKGRISQEACYNRLGHELFLDPADIRKAGEELHASLRCNTNLAGFLRELKDSNEGALRIFAMSNISQPDYEALRRDLSDIDWSLFDGIFTTFEAGRRKPDPEFYRYTLSEAGLNPSRIRFIDDKPENVISACSQGLHCLVYRDFTEVKRALLNLLGDSVLRGQRVMENNGRLTSMCSGVAIQEKFSQLLILEMVDNR
ncbi:HAD-like domain-containing protein [Armillaria nabsnona]|nr:HAD-like domain-containing protein [Armillaria nabsnona]